MQRFPTRRRAPPVRALQLRPVQCTGNIGRRSCGPRECWPVRTGARIRGLLRAAGRADVRHGRCRSMRTCRSRPEAAPCPLPASRYGGQVPLPVSSVRLRAAQVARMDDYGASRVAVVDSCWRGTCRLAVAVVRTCVSPRRFWARYRIASRSTFGSSQQGQTVGPSSDTTSVAPQLVPLP